MLSSSSADSVPETSREAPDPVETAIVRRRYDRIARIYDVLDGPMELMARRWRRAQWVAVGRDDRVLEVGVGTGKSIASYPAGVRVSAIDISPRMLDRARRRAQRLGADVDLQIADVQALPFADATFDVVVSTFVFCSVPDPIRGLREIRRVLCPGGRLSMIEHVRSDRWWLRPILRALDPLTARIWGAHLDRDTVGNLSRAGFSRVESRDLALDVVKAIRATP